MSSFETQVDSATTETAILARVIRHGKTDLAPEAARYLLTLEFQDTDLRRMDELAEKARHGDLSAAEQKEIENYRHVGHLLALMRSKARLALSGVSAR